MLRCYKIRTEAELAIGPVEWLKRHWHLRAAGRAEQAHSFNSITLRHGSAPPPWPWIHRGQLLYALSKSWILWPAGIMVQFLQQVHFNLATGCLFKLSLSGPWVYEDSFLSENDCLPVRIWNIWSILRLLWISSTCTDESLINIISPATAVIRWRM